MHMSCAYIVECDFALYIRFIDPYSELSIFQNPFKICHPQNSVLLTIRDDDKMVSDCRIFIGSAIYGSDF